MTTKEFNRGETVNRRNVLKSAAIIGGLGAFGLPALSGGVAASSHTGAVYATDTNNDIYSIDVVTGGATFLTAAGVSGSVNINGNAYDAANSRFYFTTFDGSGQPSSLYFIDVTSSPYPRTSAGTLDGGAASGTFFNGAYYYVKNATDELTKVTLDASGVKTSEQFVANLPNNQYDLNFGDIVFESADTLYFSAVKTSGGGSLAGIVDLGASSTTFTEWNYSTWGGIGALQLALTADGTLYGQDAGDGQFYTIATATGALTSAFNTGKTFTDLGGDWLGCIECESDELLAKYEFACVDEVDGECIEYDFVLEEGDSSLVSYEGPNFVSKDDEAFEPVSATFGTDYCTVYAVVKAGRKLEVQELVAEDGEVTAEGIGKYAISFVAFYCDETTAQDAADAFPSKGRK